MSEDVKDNTEKAVLDITGMHCASCVATVEKSLKNLEGGVIFNIGSAVIMPEVFLKALTIARNLGYKIQNFTAVNMDMIQHYRPFVNVVDRPTAQGGTGIKITGHHEIMIPLLAAAIKERLNIK